MAKINIDKLDDVQLAMYLAQKNNQGQPTLIIKREAESILEWIRGMRNQSKKKQEATIKLSTESELLFKELADKWKPEQFNYPHWSL